MKTKRMFLFIGVLLMAIAMIYLTGDHSIVTSEVIAPIKVEGRILP